MSNEVLRRLVQLSTPAQAAGAWSFLGPVSLVRQLSFVNSGIWESLNEAHSTEELLSAQVLIQLPDREPAMNPVLLKSPALFLRRDRDDSPYDVVTSNGALVSDDPPAFDSSRDYFTRRWAGKSKRILAASSDADLAVLRMLGLPSTTAAGLGSLDGQQFRRLFRPLYENRPPVAVDGYELVLVGVDLAMLKNELPEGMRRILKFLALAEETYGIETENRMRVWQPTHGEFQKITLATIFQDRGLAHKLIRRSVNDSTCTVWEFHERESIRNPALYDVARRELLQIIAEAHQNQFYTSEIGEKLDALSRSFGKHVVDMILKDAMFAKNSLDRSLLIVAAEIIEHWHNTSSLVRSTQAGVADRRRPLERPLSPEAFKDRVRIADELVKIHRVLSQRK